MAKKEKVKKKKPPYSAASNFAWTLKMMMKYCKSVFFISAILVPINIGMSYLGIYLPSLVVTEVTSGNTLESVLLSVGTVMLLTMLGGIAASALGYVRTGLIGIYRYKVSAFFIHKSLSIFYQSYEKKEVHDLADRASAATNMNNGQQPLGDMALNGFGLIQNLLGYILFGSVISFASPWLVPILTLTPLVNFISARLLNNWGYSHRDKIADLGRKLNYVQGLPDNFAMAKDIRIYSMASWLRECYRELSRALAKWDMESVKRSFVSGLSGLLVILIRDGGAYALLISMFYKGQIEAGEFVLYFAAISSFASWVGGIISSWNSTHATSLILCDFREYIDYPENDGTGAAVSADHMNTVPEIEFRNVCFRYDGAEKDTISDLSLTVKSGEKLALVGLNGAGKTTLVKLMCGLYRPTSGEIYFNGIPLGDFKRNDYYKLISPVFQETKTAFFSLAETVSGKITADTDLARAEMCIRKAGLGGKIDSLPRGIHTRLDKRVNKDGTELSGGECQKLMLARALYKDAPLLILDEPTAALDPIAESKIYEEYNEMTEGKTSLFISHRLASTLFCDRIVLLEDGRIAEDGTHKELLAAGGKYRELFDIQSCWYREDDVDLKGGDGNENGNDNENEAR